ncbi:MAG: VWA domain-containing protein, partial [Bdellovibrionales bacterium]|nr:VWA domain-containing protein [Bdellovibrionales bacterium]
MAVGYLHELLNATLLSPEWLWALAALPLFALLALMRRTGNVVSIVLRLLAFSALVLALAEPVSREATEQHEVVALLDVSRSVLPEARARQLELLQSFSDQQKNLSVSMLLFGGDVARNPIIVTPEQSVNSLRRSVERAMDATDTGKSDIGGAVQHAVSTTASSSLLLLSDGFETEGDMRAAAAAARSKGVRVFPLLPDPEVFQAGALSISSLHAPLTVPAGEVIEVRAAIRNGFSQERSARLELWLESTKLYSNIVSVPANQERLISVKSPPAEGGLKRIRARLLPADASNDTPPLAEQHRWVSVKEKSQLLFLSGDETDRRVLGRLIKQKGFAARDMIADGQSPIPTTFDKYSLVILNNVAKRQLPKEFLPALEQYVKSGGGLLLIGGDRSFGLGDYSKTELEELSPVEFLPPRTTKRRLNNAVVLILDKSRSMVFDNKIEAAKAAALTSIRSLKDDDYVGVIGFDSAPFVIIRLDQVANVKPIADRRMR